MASNPTIKATITAEDKASPVVKNIGSSFEGLGKSAEKAGLSFGQMTTAIGLGGVAAMAMHTAMNTLESATKSAIGSASNFEQYRIGFETMLGSADAAKAMLQNLSDFAMKTPFTLPSLVDATKQMLAMGISANEVLPDIKALGDISAGVGANKLPEISLAFAQVAAKGHLAGQEIIQFSNAGVPVIDEVAKSLGKTRAETIKLSESGQISFGQVRKAIIAMTEPGGRFFDLMQKQSGTFGGTMSNISDQFGRLSRQILGISENGDIQAGGPFAHLKTGAETFMNFITNNANKIASFFQVFIQIGEKAFQILKRGIEAVGPGFIVTTLSTIAFGIALFGLVTTIGTIIRVAISLTTFMGGLGAVLIAVSVVAGIVMGKAFETMNSKIKNAMKSTFDFSKLMGNDVPGSAQATGKAVDKLGQQLGDLDDQMTKSTRDFREQMAQMIKSSQDKVKTLQGQLNDETSNFKDAQDKQASDHADKIQTIEDQINKETQMGVLADQTKLANLQRELDKEDAAYAKQAAKVQSDHDKKMADLQAQLDAETQLLQKHADDVKSIQDVTLLDTIDSLKRSHDEQMDQYEKQKERIVQNANSTGADAGVAMGNAFKSAIGLTDSGAIGNNLGSEMGKAMKEAFIVALKSIGHDVMNWGEALAQTIVDISLLRQLSRHKTAQQLFEDNLSNFERMNSGKATGGNVQAGQIYPVGEQGMEFFAPEVNGRIIPNNKIGGIGGGSPINITIQAGAFMGTQIEARKYAMMIMGAYNDAMAMKGMA